MLKSISIPIYEDLNRLNSAWLNLYGISDKQQIEDLNASISDRNRNFTYTFYEDKICIVNKDKDDKNTLFYDELYKIVKKNDAYFLFTNHLQYYFIKKDDFSDDEFLIIEKWLEPYHSKSLQDNISEIKCYNSKSIKRLMKLIKATTKNIFIGGHILLFLAISVIWFIKEGGISSIKDVFIFFCISLFAQILYIIIMFIILLFVSTIAFMKSDTYKAKMIFHKRELEIIGITKPSHAYIKYSNFYKIKKVNKGYLFIIQNQLGFFFFEKEICESKKGELEKVLKEFYKK